MKTLPPASCVGGIYGDPLAHGTPIPPSLPYYSHVRNAQGMGNFLGIGVLSFPTDPVEIVQNEGVVALVWYV